GGGGPAVGGWDGGAQGEPGELEELAVEFEAGAKARAAAVTGPSLRGTKEEVVERDEDLDHDQRDDDRLEPDAAPGVDDVGQGVRRFIDHAHLAGQRHGPLLQLIFVGEPRIEALDLRV